MNTEISENLKQLYNNPVFKNAFVEYLEVMQKEGITAMVKFWEMFPRIEKLIDSYPLLKEQITNYYSIIGLMNESKGQTSDKPTQGETPDQLRESIVTLCKLYSKERQSQSVQDSMDFMTDVVSKIACKLTEKFEETLNNLKPNE
ncbi:MAG: hypothetical protein HQK91_08935 [Nitrospirae bacterium]|nr:hypothetical protein [Nitrospirota bacterium]